MRFRFHNLGPVDTADLTLGDLTIIGGRNNTGKTYLTYALYGFLKAWRPRSALSNAFSGPWRAAITDPQSPTLPRLRRLTRSVAADGEALQPINRQDLHRARTQLLTRLASHFTQSMLPSVFSSASSEFHDAALLVEIDEPFPESVPPVRSRAGRHGHLVMLYRSDTLVVRWTGGDHSDHILSRMISALYHRLLCASFPEPFILSAERFGISLFHKELDFTKSQLVNLLQNIDTREARAKISPYLIIDESTSRYALPIKDNIDYTRGLSGTPKRLGPLSRHRMFNDIKDMMGGYYKVAGDDILFRSKARGVHKFEIPLHLASSSARGMSDLYFFLKYVAHRNHLLIVDEPESHLDTANQIELARLLSRLVRRGIKVLITTHSDYLIKEINNLIMLDHLIHRTDVTANHSDYSPEDALPRTAVRAYVARDRGLFEAPIDRFGIDMPIFDETIDSINRTANGLAAALELDVADEHSS